MTKPARYPKETALRACMAAKYAFALVFPLLCVLFQGKSWGYLAVAAAEVALVLCVTELLARVRLWLAYVPNTLLLLFVNGQFAVLYWGSTFVSAPMLDNLDSVRALSGKAVLYILTVVLVIVFSALPVCEIKRVKLPVLFGVPAALYLAVVGLGLFQYSPFYAATQTYVQMTRWNRLLTNVDGEVDGGDFFRTEVADHRARPEELPPSPNVILVFVEGFSQNIIDDPRNITPNLRSLQDRGISFENYYNHTFATYMGLSGQLYSGYQHGNYDKNYLVSLQDVFSYYGYQTAFINTEPVNAEFSAYLADFDFDKVVTDEASEAYICDKDAYQLLFDTAQTMEGEGQPFFLAMYSFETHVGFDSSDQRYGDGKDPVLNKFYNVDAQIGRFMERFQASGLAEDTLVVFTGDHATYGDADFVNAFPEHRRVALELDRMPLIFYYKGVSPETWDAAGRNSIDLAPTVLDFLDMTANNYFWGESLFAPTDGDWADTTFNTNGNIYSTRGGDIHALEGEERREFEERLTRYFALKVSDVSVEEDWNENTHIYATMNEEGTALDISVYNAEEFVKFHTAVWCKAEGQDALQWFSTRREEDGVARYSVDLSKFAEDGIYVIHIYGFRDGDEEGTLMGGTIANVTLRKPEAAGISAERSE